MNNSLIIGILQNTALLLALSLVFEYFQANKKYTDNILVKIFTGIILGIIGIILMMTPWTLVPGIVFDTRSVMLSVSGLFFGPIATIIAVLVTGTYRYMLGGDGIYMGIAVILSSGIIGILWGKFFFNINSKRINLNLLFFGIIVHMVMLAWVFLLPKELQWETLSAIALPIIILYPLGTLLLGKLLFKQLLNQKAKSDLKESENKFKTLFQSMNEGFALHELIFDENENPIDYRILDVNPAFEKILGITRKRVIDKPATIAFGVETAPYLSAYANVAMKSEPISFQTFFEPLEKHFMISVFSPQKGKFATVFSDITEMVKLEEQIKQEQALLTAIFDNIEEGIVVCDENGILQRFNEATRRFHGLPEKNIPAEEWSQYYDLYMPDGKTLMQKQDVPLFRALQDGEVKNAELMIIPKNGEPKSFISSGKRLVNENGKTIGAVSVMHNITEQKKIEIELSKYRKNLETLVEVRTKALEIQTAKIQESQTALTYLLEDVNESREQLKDVNVKLEATNKELESFSYSVSHDLRAPLRAIDGFSQVLLEDYSDILDDQGQDYLNRVRSGAQSMAALIDDLLNLSKVTRAPINLENVNLSQITQNIANELFLNNENRSVDLIIEKELYANADESLIRVAIQNLLENAWKFTSKKSSAKIEFGHTEIDNQKVYFIRDNGAGFDMKYIDKIFVPFKRLHTSTDFPGTGIGLATVQRIINGHKGKVWAESEIDIGTTVYFTIS